MEMPMIRVDDEVYTYLNKRGRTEDSFNDVIRRELGLGERKRGKVTIVSKRTERWSLLEPVLDNHLPPHWSSSPARADQILRVVDVFLKTSKEWGTKKRHLYAANDVAMSLGVTMQTVEDKCGRQLYDSGQLQPRFRAALEAIEAELEG